MVPQIAVDEDVFRYIMDISEAAGVSPSTVIRRKFKVPDFVDRPMGPEWLKVYMAYKGTAVTGELNVKSKELLVKDGSHAGRRFKTPSEAAVAVISSLNPALENPSINGWKTWRLTDDDKLIDVLRGGKIDLEDIEFDARPKNPIGQVLAAALLKKK
jgi:hypothetical protein